MAPAMRRGDLAFVRRRPERLASGDVVLVTKAGWSGGILHRVESVMSDGSLRLRGDANPVADREPVALARVRGRVDAIVPFGRGFAALERLVRRWYNPGSQPKIEAMTERRVRTCTSRRSREGPFGCKGPRRHATRGSLHQPPPRTDAGADTPAYVARGGRIPPIRGRRARGPGTAAS